MFVWVSARLLLYIMGLLKGFKLPLCFRMCIFSIIISEGASKFACVYR